MLDDPEGPVMEEASTGYRKQAINEETSADALLEQPLNYAIAMELLPFRPSVDAYTSG